MSQGVYSYAGNDDDDDGGGDRIRKSAKLMGTPLHMQKLHAMQITPMCEEKKRRREEEKKRQMLIPVHYSNLESKVFSTNPGT